jgi:prevent-host-death family protein
MSPLTEIDAYEAKTRLAEYLRKVRVGEAFRIMQHGKPVADLIPADTTQRHQGAQAAIRMQQFMRKQPRVNGIDIKALISEGRN